MKVPTNRWNKWLEGSMDGSMDRPTDW